MGATALEGYAASVRRAQPDFVELKGVTFTGVGSGIGTAAVPWHEEVTESARARRSTMWTAER